jgi:hypothetical protein
MPTPLMYVFRRHTAQTGHFTVSYPPLHANRGQCRCMLVYVDIEQADVTSGSRRIGTVDSTVRCIGAQMQPGIRFATRLLGPCQLKFRQSPSHSYVSHGRGAWPTGRLIMQLRPSNLCTKHLPLPVCIVVVNLAKSCYAEFQFPPR